MNYRSVYDVTLAPVSMNQCCSSPSNLTGSYGESNNCFEINRIYKGNGGVCQSVMRDCMGCNPNEQMQKKIDAFCGPSATPGFYRDGAFWSIS